MIYDLQKASLLKRISAALFDFVMLTVVFTGCMLLISSIVNYDGYSQNLSDRLAEIHESHNITELEKEYEVKFSEYQYMLDEERAKLPTEVQDAFNACNEEISEDKQIIKLYETIMSLSLVIVSIGLLIAFLILEFAVPLYFKNGQTLGKKIFSIAVMQIDCVKIPTKVLFIRTILGKYTIGTMVPVLMLLALFFGFIPLVPIVIIFGIFLIQIVMLVTTKTNSLIHDHLASTVVVDFQSQMIFESAKAKEEYVLRIHEEKASNEEY